MNSLPEREWIEDMAAMVITVVFIVCMCLLAGAAYWVLTQ